MQRPRQPTRATLPRRRARSSTYRQAPSRRRSARALARRRAAISSRCTAAIRAPSRPSKPTSERTMPASRTPPPPHRPHDSRSAQRTASLAPASRATLPTHPRILRKLSNGGPLPIHAARRQECCSRRRSSRTIAARTPRPVPRAAASSRKAPSEQRPTDAERRDRQHHRNHRKPQDADARENDDEDADRDGITRCRRRDPKPHIQRQRQRRRSNSCKRAMHERKMSPSAVSYRDGNDHRERRKRDAAKARDGAPRAAQAETQPHGEIDDVQARHRLRQGEARDELFFRKPVPALDELSMHPPGKTASETRESKLRENSEDFGERNARHALAFAVRKGWPCT